MNASRRSTSWFFVLVIACLLLAACAQPAVITNAPKPPAANQASTEPTRASGGEPAIVGQPQETPAAGQPKVVTISFTTGDPESLNPLYAYSWGSEVAFEMFLLPLWNIDKNGNYVMELAAELPTLENGGVSADGLSITIKLRPGVKWSDGQPVTAEDAVFSYEMAMHEKNTVQSRYPWDTYVESVTAVDPQTVQIKLSSPYADWSTSMFTGISRVIPKHILQPVFDKDGTLDNAEWNNIPAVSNGPFLFVEFQRGSHLIFKANQDYWRGRPKLDEVHFRLVDDRAAQLAALASGDADVGSYIIGSEIPDLTKIGHMIIQSVANGYQVTIYENIDPDTAHPAMTDVKVRKAIAQAIDRDLINQQLFNGLYQIPATYWHGSLYDNPNLKPYPFDPEGAKKLLDEAGWVDGNGDGVREKDGTALVLRYAYVGGEEVADTMVVTIQQMLGDVGIKVDIISKPQEELWAGFAEGGPLATGQYELTHWSDGMSYFPSPDTSYFLCDQIPTPDAPDGYNWFGVCESTMDQLFQNQAIEIDPEKRISMFHQIGKIMYDHVFIIPLRSDPDVWAFSDSLTHVDFSGVDPLMWIHQWDTK
jgi:peptide/nickel transport system substrate-binding protein